VLPVYPIWAGFAITMLANLVISIIITSFLSDIFNFILDSAFAPKCEDCDLYPSLLKELEI